MSSLSGESKKNTPPETTAGKTQKTRTWKKRNKYEKRTEKREERQRKDSVSDD
jgi:hypothetical protein